MLTDHPELLLVVCSAFHVSFGLVVVVVLSLHALPGAKVLTLSLDPAPVPLDEECGVLLLLLHDIVDILSV